MSSETELISDGDGLAVIGDPAAVELFLVSEGLLSKVPFRDQRTAPAHETPRTASSHLRGHDAL